MVDSNFRPSAAIFDMDGLMLDTEKPAIGIWAKAGRAFGWEIKPDTVIRTLGIDKKGTGEIFMQEMGAGFPYEAIKEEFYRLYREEFEKKVDLKSGLIVLLDHLSALGIPVAVATSSRGGAARWKLAKAGILERFPVLACGDEVGQGKPAPDIFLLAAERLGMSPSCCVGFEDSAAGLKALHAAKIRSVFIKDMVEPPDDVLATVWRRYGNLAEAMELFW